MVQFLVARLRGERRPGMRARSAILVIAVFYRSIAQSVELYFDNPEVTGSIPGHGMLPSFWPIHLRATGITPYFRLLTFCSVLATWRSFSYVSIWRALHLEGSRREADVRRETDVW